MWLSTSTLQVSMFYVQHYDIIHLGSVFLWSCFRSTFVWPTFHLQLMVWFYHSIHVSTLNPQIPIFQSIITFVFHATNSNQQYNLIYNSHTIWLSCHDLKCVHTFMLLHYNFGFGYIMIFHSMSLDILTRLFSHHDSSFDSLLPLLSYSNINLHSIQITTSISMCCPQYLFSISIFIISATFTTIQGLPCLHLSSDWRHLHGSSVFISITHLLIYFQSYVASLPWTLFIKSFT
jgi:hypothetical protein